MPQIKLLIDNQVVYESTDPTSIKSILKKIELQWNKI